MLREENDELRGDLEERDARAAWVSQEWGIAHALRLKPYGYYIPDKCLWRDAILPVLIIVE